MKKKKDFGIPVGEFKAVWVKLFEEGELLFSKRWDRESRAQFPKCLAAFGQPRHVEWIVDDAFWLYFRDGFDCRLLFRRVGE